MNAPQQNITNSHTVFFVSDGTGLTAETNGRSLLAQFPRLDFNTVTLAFIDSEEKALKARDHINAAFDSSGVKPVVFCTLVEKSELEVIHQSHALVIDLFNTFLEPLEKIFGMESAHTLGLSKTILGKASYLTRLDAIDYSLSHDDGVRPDQYDEADIILVGVSRCGKTPTSLYLAMNFSLKVSNYPLVEDDLQCSTLPAYLQQYMPKLVGLTIKPVPLSRIRKKRRPNSDYASLPVCQKEIETAEYMFKAAGIPVFDTTETSIEEIATYVVKTLGVSRERTGFA